MGHVGVFGLEGPADEGGEASRLVLELADSVEVLNSLGQGFDMAEHHGGARLAPQLMPDPADVEPVVGHHFAAGDGGPHAIDQNLATPPGQASQPGRLQPLEHLLQRPLADLGEVVDFGGAEGVDVDLRKRRPNVAQQLFVPLQRQRRVQAPLHQDLIAPQLDRLGNLLVQLLPLQHVDFRMLGRSIERTEIADRRAGVGVVDVAIDIERAVRLGMQPAGHRVGRLTNRLQVVRLEQPHSFFRGQSLTGDSLVKQR